jgi:hypothetical protein
LLKESGVKAEFCLLGFLDVQNPAAISSEQMKEWTDQGYVKYLGVSDDVRNILPWLTVLFYPPTERVLLERC